jgi:hypothetical protein
MGEGPAQGWSLTRVLDASQADCWLRREESGRWAPCDVVQRAAQAALGDGGADAFASAFEVDAVSEDEMESELRHRGIRKAHKDPLPTDSFSINPSCGTTP